MSRKSFSELNVVTYKISVHKCVLIRKLKWMFEKKSIATKFEETPLPIKIHEHASLIRRRLGNVDMTLQENKAINLAIAKTKIDGIIISPGEKFSFWYLVGSCVKSKGYQEGMVIKNGDASKGIGGGMCQFTNMIHWLVLHSPLTIIEHHHHNNLDFFPDYGRQVPFGTGTSIMYNYLDYQFVNHTKQKFQIKISMNSEYFIGELRSDMAIPNVYHISEENQFFNKEKDIYYRNNEVYRSIYDKRSGNLIQKELIVMNHSKVMYDEEFIPKDMVCECRVS